MITKNEIKNLIKEAEKEGRAVADCDGLTLEVNFARGDGDWLQTEYVFNFGGCDIFCYYQEECYNVIVGFCEKQGILED